MSKTKDQKQAGSPLRDKTLQFAIRIVNLYKHLAYEKKEYVMSKQILKSGTNPGAMVREAQNAESSKDFIHKLGVGRGKIKEIRDRVSAAHLLSLITHL